MPDISDIISASLLPEAAGAQPDNMNIVAILTGQQTGPIKTANRYQLYKNAADVAADFGSSSEAAAFAAALFNTTPNPANVGGVLAVAYFRNASETVAATAGKLVGGWLDEAAVIAAAQKIQDGSFIITVDAGAPETNTAIDLRTVLKLEDIATALKSAITGVTSVTVETSADGLKKRFVITSSTTGATSAVSLFTPDVGVGTFLGVVLALAASTGAVAIAGAASATLTAETEVDALTALKAVLNVKGATFCAGIASAHVPDVAAWAVSNKTLVYEVFSDVTNLDVDPTNKVWAVKLASQKFFRCLHSLAGNRQMAATYMARVHTVDFGAEGSANTIHLKDLAIVPEVYTETQVTKAANVGADIYTTIDKTPGVLSSGANDFVDNVYNLLAFINTFQVDQFNLLKTSPTKIPQTTRGQLAQVDAAEQTCRRFVRAGVFAPGTWTAPVPFGDPDTFKTAIEQNGFYVLASSLADQSPTDRAARKAPTLQVAVKNAGAIHSANTVINFEL